MVDMITAVGIYLLIVNILGFVLMGIDKHRSRNKAWRIAEKTFYLISLLGGSAGCWTGMYLFRHKTKHWGFVIGIPVILILQIVLLILLLLTDVI